MTAPSKSEFRLVFHLFGYAARQRPSIIPITLLGIASSVVELGAVGSVIPLAILAGGKGIPAHSVWYKIPVVIGCRPDAKFFVVFFLALMLLRMGTFMLAQILNAYSMHTLMAHLSTRAHAMFIRHISFAEIVQHQIGHFITLAGDEANRGAQIVLGVMKLLPVIFLFLTYIGIIIYQSWVSGLALLGLLVVMVMSLRSAFRKSLALGQRQQEESRVAGTHFIESLSGLRTVRSFTAENFVTSHYSALMKKYSWTLFLNDTFAQMTQAPAIIFILILLIAVVGGADSHYLVEEMPFFLAGIMMFMRLLPVANQGLEAALRLTANLKAGRNVAEMLATIQQSDQTDELPNFPADQRIKRIEFDNVSFQYSPDAPPVLKDFCCTFEAGKSYALTGPSGVGKSSLTDLLLKFFVPLEGSIRINGLDISKVSNDSLRQHIVLAEQTTRIFHGTVLENVQFGHSNDDKKAHAALRVVGLQELLQSLPHGADTIMSFQGNNFSGGQRQRVGLARALARRADVLILDESTNALDRATREQILDALMADYRGRILIFVTHDTYVMDRVDTVIQMRPVMQTDETVIAAAQ